MNTVIEQSDVYYQEDKENSEDGLIRRIIYILRNEESKFLIRMKTFTQNETDSDLLEDNYVYFKDLESAEFGYNIFIQMQKDLGFTTKLHADNRILN